MLHYVLQSCAWWKWATNRSKTDDLPLGLSVLWNFNTKFLIFNLYLLLLSWREGEVLSKIDREKFCSAAFKEHLKQGHYKWWRFKKKLERNTWQCLFCIYWNMLLKLGKKKSTGWEVIFALLFAFSMITGFCSCFIQCCLYHSKTHFMNLIISC